MRNEVVILILKVLERENEMRQQTIDLTRGEAVELYGTAGALDSMGLVSLIVEVETEIHEQYAIPLTLVSNSAMSAQRSPFSTVGSMADYVVKQMQELPNGQ